MRPVEERKKRVLQAARDIFGPDDEGFWLDARQVDIKTLYKNSHHGRVLSEKLTKLIGVFHGKNNINIRKGVNYTDFLECFAHEVGHYLSHRNGFVFHNMETEEAYATYFSFRMFERNRKEAIRKTHKLHNNKKMVRSYRFKKYKTHWKYAADVATFILSTKKCRMFRKMMKEEYMYAIPR